MDCCEGILQIELRLLNKEISLDLLDGPSVITCTTEVKKSQRVAEEKEPWSRRRDQRDVKLGKDLILIVGSEVMSDHRQGTRSTSRSWEQPRVHSRPENRGLLLMGLELNAANNPKESGSTFCPRASWYDPRVADTLISAWCPKEYSPVPAGLWTFRQ